MSIALYEKELEWDVCDCLDENAIVTTIGDIEIAPNKLRVKITRDDEYRISCVVSGIVSIDAWRELRAYLEGIPGSDAKYLMLEADYGFLHKVELNNSVISKANSRYIHGEKHKRYIELEMYVGEVVITSIHEPLREKMLVEWYLNGPRNTTKIWNGVTEREYSPQIKRTRKKFNKQFGRIEWPPNGTPSQTSSRRDFMTMEFCGTQIVIAAVPQEYDPNWSDSISIQYPANPNGFVKKDIREVVSEIVGFVFGRQLLCIGESRFDEIGQLVNAKSNNPWGRDTKHVCKAPDLPPVKIPEFNPEELLCKLLHQYNKLKETYGIGDALLYYNVARQMPLGVELPLFAASLELLMHSWFKCNTQGTKGEYLGEKEYRKIIREQLDSIQLKLKDNPYVSRIINKINSAWKMGVNEKYSVFFEELGIQMSTAEQKAIRARNRSAHGGRIDHSRVQKEYRYHNIYRTLITE